MVETAFDLSDVDYLAKYFDIRELRRMITISRQKEGVYRSDHDTYNEYLERELQTLYQKTLDFLVNFQPKHTEVKTGYVDIDNLKIKADIVNIAERYTHLRKSGKNFIGKCPLHVEKSASFYIYPEQQSWHCYGACSTGGDVISLVMKVEHVDFKGAIALLR